VTFNKSIKQAITESVCWETCWVT